jgi:hypothetical protein
MTGAVLPVKNNYRDVVKLSGQLQQKYGVLNLAQDSKVKLPLCLTN